MHVLTWKKILRKLKSGSDANTKTITLQPVTWWRFGEKAFQVTLNIKCFSFYKYNFQWTRILQHIFKATERSNVSHILETSWCKEKCSKKYSFVFLPCFDDFTKVTSMMRASYKLQWFQYLRYNEGSHLYSIILNQTASLNDTIALFGRNSFT